MNINKIGLVGIVALVMILTAVGGASAEIPPTPITLVGVASGGDVNYTWAAGSGNVTDGYNVSVSLSGATATWTNATAAFLLTSPGENEYVDIYVYAYNNTDAGNTSLTYVHSQDSAEYSMFGQVIELMEAIPSVLTPVLAVIVIVIMVMGFMAVGYLITGTIEQLSDVILNAIKFKK